MVYGITDVGAAYSILGLEEGATRYEVTSVFRSMAKDHHPDHHQGSREHEELFKEALAARNYLRKHATFDPEDDGSEGFYLRTRSYLGEEDVEDAPEPYNEMEELHEAFMREEELMRRGGKVIRAYRTVLNGDRFRPGQFANGVA
ncbi:MAG: DnaJ domain-containing protein [Candidatus Undinarchaeales archaeon]|jgi:DnaJ-class molecular chaperone|nr:DnaJ domain-containing protein [Candidatus Undinarchaeales archaeon]MDP7494022.1 DnaJ domain-containing protein [Candidatus Undinarchaeales archaeon]